MRKQASSQFDRETVPIQCLLLRLGQRMRDLNCVVSMLSPPQCSHAVNSHCFRKLKTPCRMRFLGYFDEAHKSKTIFGSDHAWSGYCWAWTMMQRRTSARKMDADPILISKAAAKRNIIGILRVAMHPIDIQSGVLMVGNTLTLPGPPKRHSKFSKRQQSYNVNNQESH